jgi:hypothetical protein
VFRPADERIDHPGLHHVAEREQHGRDGNQHDQGIEAEGRKQGHREIHGNGHHLAMGEVDDPYHAENDRKPERH